MTIYDGPSTELSQMVNETHDTDPSPAFSIRRTLQSGGIALVILVGMLLGGAAISGVFEAGASDHTTTTFPSMVDALSFAGVMITIIAFVSAFYVLLLAIDAFKISSDVAKNTEYIEKNLADIKNLKKEINDAEYKIINMKDDYDLIQKDIHISSDILQELNESSTETDKLVLLIDRITRSLEFITNATKHDQERSHVIASKYALSVRSKLPEFSKRNMLRQARITILSQLVSDPSIVDRRTLNRAVVLMREEANNGDQAAKRLIEKIESAQASPD